MQESDLLQKIDQLSKDNNDLTTKMHNKENDTTDSSPGNEHEMSKLQKLLDTERILKQQAVNKLAEIMTVSYTHLTLPTIYSV